MGVAPSLGERWSERKGSFRPECNYTVLILGQTGSGKTSFMNLLANLHCVNNLKEEVTPSDFHRFAEDTVSDDSIENALHDPMASKTSYAKIYKVKVLSDLFLTVIDTPGFGDSRGIDEDNVHVTHTIDTLTHLGGVNCVLITINGRDCRLTATLKYVLARLTAVMPQAVLDNLCVVFTNTEKQRKLNFDISTLTEVGLKSPPFVCLDNPLCEVQRMIKSEQVFGDGDAEEMKPLVATAQNALVELFIQIAAFKPVPTLRFVELNRQREDIEALLANILQKHSEEHARIVDLENIKTQILATGEVHPVVRNHESFSLEPKMFDWCHYVCNASGCHCNCTESGVVSPFAMIWCLLNGEETCVHCGHQYCTHIVSTRGWRSTITQEIVNMGDIDACKTAKERLELAVANLENEQAKARDEMAALSLGLHSGLEDYSKLGLRDAYQRMLKTQRMLLSERLVANPEDQTLQDMHSAVSKILEEVERVAELECCICMEAFADTQLNCGHRQFCEDCSHRLGFCPLCRVRVTTRKPAQQPAGSTSPNMPSTPAPANRPE